ncbi:MAG TPA: NAD(P)-dependent oxidoreductase [Steroidobacteraceae bacterium]
MRVGFIGLGAMGRHMAANLHQAGLLTAVFNRTFDKAQAFAGETGVIAVQKLTDLSRHCDAIVLCVSADADVREVVSAIAPTLPKGSLVIDCSTIGASTAREVAAQLAARGIDFLDCPVSGGVEGARDATLAIMVGGDAVAFERALPILRALGKTVTHLGPSGAGQATKATNQIMCAGVIQAVAEAMAFARAEGLPLEKLIDTLGKGAGSSWYFVNRAPNVVRGSFPAGFRVRLHEKDLKICREMAAARGVQLPVIEMTLLHYRRLIEQGFGDEDISSLYRLKAALFDEAKAAGRTTAG